MTIKSRGRPPKKSSGQPVGRPKIDIDWKKVEALLTAGYTGIEVASEIGIHKDTLYDTVKDKFGVNFSDYAVNLYSKGDGLIKYTRFQKAIKGNVQLLLYLSEVRLKERRGEDLLNVDAETLRQFNDLMSQINRVQQSNSESNKPQDLSESSDLNMEENNINTEHRS